jgi:SAM-dependent methyltransferase
MPVRWHGRRERLIDMSSEKCCPVCNEQKTSIFINRYNVPVHQNLLMADRDAARHIRRGDLCLAYCKNCGFIFNTSFDPEKLSYSSDYDNNQSFSSAFHDYINDLVRGLIDTRGVKNSRIVEIGCGKGYFLRQLIEDADAGNTGIGFDPSYIGPLSCFDGRLQFKKSNFGPAMEHIPADIVVCRHVIEHIAEPVAFLRSIRAALEKNPEARIFFETPCVRWILENKVTWDFFYEHCSYFFTNSLLAAFSRAGFCIQRITPIFKGQYLWIEASMTETPVVSDPDGISELARVYARDEEKMLDFCRKEVSALAHQGGVALWGAAAKGVTFANLIDPDCRFIACVVDINPNKQGHFLPGTGHPIVGPGDLARFGIRSVVLMNPNYYDEVCMLIEKEHIQVAVIDLPMWERFHENHH